MVIQAKKLSKVEQQGFPVTVAAQGLEILPEHDVCIGAPCFWIDGVLPTVVKQIGGNA